MVPDKKVNYLIADTTAFIQNAPLQEIANHVVTVQEVIDEISNKRQLRRLAVLPYDLIIKNVFPENVNIITEFSKKTGDYRNLSATDIKVMALTYQFEKEKVGTEHLRTEPIVKNTINITSKLEEETVNVVTGFFMPKHDSKDVLRISDSETIGDLQNDSLTNEINLVKLEENTDIPLESENNTDLLVKVDDEVECLFDGDYSNDEDDDDDDEGWITPLNVQEAKKQIHSENLEEKSVEVACMTTDFAMQNVLKQMKLNVSALDGRIIKQLKTYILRCYSCFKTTSIVTQQFCPKCGNNTLKRVSVSVDDKGNQKIHINARHPLTARGKKFSMPAVQGGKHSKNPILSADQPLPDQRPTRLARTKNNPLEDGYIAGFSPFVMRDINSKSAMLGIRSTKEVKHWMRKNPNEARRKRK